MASPVPGISADFDATIASGASLSDSVPLFGHVLCGVYMPASWTAASLTFQASNDNVTFYDVYADGAEYEIVTSAGQYIAFSAANFLGIKYLKVRSGTSGSAVNQGAERVIKLMAGRPVD